MRFNLTVLTIALATVCSAQESPFYKFGKITPATLQQKTYPLDSSASAVVLSDVGEAAIEGNSKGWFSVITTRHKVVHILAKSAYDEATVEVPLYTNGLNEERLEELKAVTYNLEAGKVTEAKLEKSGLFTEKRTNNLIVKKFTLPAVKEGSIIEYQYKVSSDFISHVDPWSFQGEKPVLWSEFLFSVPQFFSYSFISHGYLRPFINDKKDRSTSFAVRETRGAGATENYNFTSGVTDYRWVMKDVPQLKPESYVSALENHLARLEFQLASKNYPLEPKNYRGSWPGLTKELLEDESFGKGVTASNGWLNDEEKLILRGAVSETEKARAVYQYVRNRFTCTRSVGIGAEQSVKNTFKSGKGTVSEINLLLTAMLRAAGLNADPVILSKTSHGYAYDLYPMLNRFNYVVTQVQADGRMLYLDASHNHLGFNKLLPECYNGHARVVNEEATPLYLVADSLHDRKVTALFLTKGAKTLWEGNMNQTPGYYESYGLRERIKADGEASFFKAVQKDFGGDVIISEPHIDSLTNYDMPLGIKYALDYNPEKADILYINPLFGEGYKKNPFKSAERAYPVEMPYATDETFILNMEVPDGYEVDELPKQIMVKLDDAGKSFFEYRIQADRGTVALRSRVKLDRAYYEPDEYVNLREFFNLIVKKHNEQIVFKKKK